jgi:hypothetical protein
MSLPVRLLVIFGVLGAILLPSLPARANIALVNSVDKSQPFALSATLANRVRDDEQDTAIQLMQEAGVQWAREEIFWHQVQAQPNGPYRWTGSNGFYNYDASIARLDKAGINVLGLLDYSPAWTAGTSATLNDWIDDWGDFVYTTVLRYGAQRGQIKHWEIWNEPNLRRFGYENGIHSVGDYVRLLDVARAAAKAADPEAVIVLAGITSIWSEIPTPQDYDVATYLQLLYEAGGWNSFDILAIHPYRPGAPEAASLRRDTNQDFEAELRVVDGLLERFGHKRVWITEVSWSSYDGFYGVTETEQAAYLVRMYMLALSHPWVERIFWYNFRDDTAPNAPYTKPEYNRQEPEFHWGLLRRAYPLDADSGNLRKPAFVAYRTMTEVLGGMTPQTQIANGYDEKMPGTFAYHYSGNGRNALVMWRIYGSTSPVITLDCDCKDARVRQWDGKLLAALQTEGGLVIRLDYVGVPIYVEWGEDRDSGGQYFAETGHRVSGAFLEYWRENGGLKQFGYPITPEITEPEFGSGRPRTVQYFERNRFEYFGEIADPNYRVQLGRLGDDLLRTMGIDWRTLPAKNETADDCITFEQTGRHLCPPFREYWEQNGGLSMYGLPLTEAFNENGLLVQYFERNRFEHHPEQAGTPFEIALGLLGRDMFSRWGVWP